MNTVSPWPSWVMLILVIWLRSTIFSLFTFFPSTVDKKQSVGRCFKTIYVCACVLSHVRLFATLWTAAHQAPESMGFSRPEYWSGLPFPPPGDLPDPGIRPESPALQAVSLLLSHQKSGGSDIYIYMCVCVCVCVCVCIYLYIYISHQNCSVHLA